MESQAQEPAKEKLPIEIRAETPADSEAIKELTIVAFGETETAELSERIRKSENVITSLIAESNGLVVGHILFSKINLENEAGSKEIAALAPLAVLPKFQGKGIGSELTRAGLAECKELGFNIVVVLGHPTYYAKFGFSSELAKNISSPFSGRPSWMALELKPDTLQNVHGKITYPEYFGIEKES